MLDTQGQSGQALLFCLRYDFPTEWAAFVNGAGTDPFVASADLAALETGLNSAAGSATLTLPPDSKVLTRDVAQQVFLVLGYSFGKA